MQTPHSFAPMNISPGILERFRCWVNVRKKRQDRHQIVNAHSELYFRGFTFSKSMQTN